MPNTPTRHPDPQLPEALALHQAGRLQAAEARYGRILPREPGNRLACYHLGLAQQIRADGVDLLVTHTGESLLRAMCMPEWIAVDQDDYVATAVDFAGDPIRFRSGLRERFMASPLTDETRFAGHFEVALQGMWQPRCEGQNAAQS